ncbi:MAG: hypothetical protein ACOYT9_04395 [Patescibacteria group bacterium]
MQNIIFISLIKNSMEVLFTLIGIAKYFAIGAASIRIAHHKKMLTENLPLSLFTVYSFTAGVALTSGILTFGLFVNQLPLVTLFTWALAIAAILYMLFYERVFLSRLFFTNVPAKIVATILYVVSVLSVSTQAILANDARGIWMLKAKGIFLGYETFFAQLKNPIFTYTHQDYPLSMPILYADLMRPLGYFWEPAVGIFSMTVLFMIGLGLFWALTSFTSIKRPFALLFALLLIGTPEYLRQGWVGLSDVPLSLAIFVSASLLASSSTNTKTQLLAIAAGIFAATIKNEGQPFLLLITLLAMWQIFQAHKLNKNSFKLYLPVIIGAGIFSLPLLAWKITTMRLGIENDVVGAPLFSELLTRVPLLITEVMPRLLDGYRFGILLVPAILLLLIPRKDQRRNIAQLLIAGQFTLYMLIYLITPHDMVWHISTSFSRLLLHLLPSIYLLTLLHRTNKSIV